MVSKSHKIERSVWWVKWRSTSEDIVTRKILKFFAKPLICQSVTKGSIRAASASKNGHAVLVEIC